MKSPRCAGKKKKPAGAGVRKDIWLAVKKECPLEGHIERLSQGIAWLVEQEKKRAAKRTLRQWCAARFYAAPLKQQIRTVTLRSDKSYTLDL